MNLTTFDLKLLLAFEALFEERGVTAAARRIGLGQSGMSAALGRLRAVFNDELFVRAGGEMRPTTKALELAPGVAASLAQIRQTLEGTAVFDPATAARSFAIGSADYTAQILVPPLIARIAREAPRIDLRVLGYEKGSVPDMLDRGEIDVAIGVFPSPPGRVVKTALFAERFVGVTRAGHPAITGGQIARADFARLPHALVTYRRDARGALDDALAAQGLTRRIALTSPYLMMMVNALEDSDLIMALPSRLADKVLAGGRLQRFELPLEVPPWTVDMLWPASARNDPALGWLRATLVACAKASPAPGEEAFPQTGRA